MVVGAQRAVPFAFAELAHCSDDGQIRHGHCEASRAVAISTRVDRRTLGLPRRPSAGLEAPRNGIVGRSIRSEGVVGFAALHPPYAGLLVGRAIKCGIRLGLSLTWESPLP